MKFSPVNYFVLNQKSANNIPLHDLIDILDLVLLLADIPFGYLSSHLTYVPAYVRAWNMGILTSCPSPNCNQWWHDIH